MRLITTFLLQVTKVCLLPKFRIFMFQITRYSMKLSLHALVLLLPHIMYCAFASPAIAAFSGVSSPWLVVVRPSYVEGMLR
jgi:hypothetical protein